LEIYSQARIRAKRETQQRVVEMIMPDDTKIMMQRMGWASDFALLLNKNGRRVRI
jgi:hypothetical protein